MSYNKDQISEKTAIEKNETDLGEYFTAPTGIKALKELDKTISEELGQFFNLKEGFIPNENWSKVQLISGRVVKVTKNDVSCECIFYVDDHKEYQIRNFSKTLFEHIEPLKEGKLIKIKISQKAGSFRIDIIDGKDG